MFPNGSFTSAQFRRALQLQRGIAALDGEGQRVAGTDADDALHVGEAADGLAVDRGDDVADLKARPLAAALLASILSTRAVVLGLPKKVNRQVKITIARMKFAIGPAATIAARGRLSCDGNCPPAPPRSCWRALRTSGVEASLSSPKNFT